MSIVFNDADILIQIKRKEHLNKRYLRAMITQDSLSRATLDHVVANERNAEPNTQFISENICTDEDAYARRVTSTIKCIQYIIADK